ncbi:PdxA family protein [Halobacteriovorax sp. HLS]|uniref:PdxA family dehydrogenase n=1 Tax=Halobacteriovorax sp. HLS TaxID=2234000 RepID=UPI000FD75F91|nr:4-hydroxythreonine-4-phosphate dehydrogenase PdxA [Halobacteriovorax sp. HLS]
MIFITQGHEKAVGLEVFLRSFVLLSKQHQKSITLVCCKDTLIKNLNLLNFSFEISEKLFLFCNSALKIIEFKKDEISESTRSLEIALSKIKKGDILLTLPTSKDQLILEGQNCKGYTEFLRKRFLNENLCMVFRAFNHTTLLITDHIPLSQVPSTVTRELIESKVNTCINYLDKYFNTVDEVIISGLNPHCGENGLLGTEDSVIDDAVKELNKSIKVIGPVSGDTLHFHNNININQLKVYIYHDQGLAPFKNQFKTIGLNITFGLPFIRMSVDHGTAFDLYGRGVADFSGCYYMLKEAIKLDKK